MNIDRKKSYETDEKKGRGRDWLILVRPIKANTQKTRPRNRNQKQEKQETHSLFSYSKQEKNEIAE